MGNRILVTGGVRSGKSSYAQSLMGSEKRVTYVTPGYPADETVDPDWANRVRLHQESRPVAWTTLETLDVAAAIRGATASVLFDCCGVWLTRTLDEIGAWASPRPEWDAALAERTEAFVDAWIAAPTKVVAVTNEVGWGVVPPHESGRLFADELGRLNQRLGAAADEVWLLVAGRPLRL